MTLGVESRSQSQERRCLRILPCPLFLFTSGHDAARQRRAWRPGSRPGRACGRTRAAGRPAPREPAGIAAGRRDDRRGGRRRHAHKQERALNAETTALCLVTGALFPVLGYDSTLALVFSMPGLPVRPGTPVPTGPAYSKARARSGEAPARAVQRPTRPAAAFPRSTAPRSAWRSPRSTVTLELFRVAAGGGIRRPLSGAKPLLRLVGLLHSGTRRWKAAVIGRYLDGENALAHGLQDAFGPGQLQPRRPRLLLHGPLHPVLRHRRAPAVAGEERREVRPLQDP